MSEVISYNEMQALFQEMRNLMQENELRLKQEREEREKARMEEEAAKKKRKAEEIAKRIERNAQWENDRAETARLIEEVVSEVGDWGNRFGEFVKSLAGSDGVKLFQERGIELTQIFPKGKSTRGGEELKIDILAVNENELVAMECRWKLSVEEIDKHIERLGKIRRMFPLWAEHRIYGAVATMVLQDDVESYAEGKGLFVIVPNGDTVEIHNGKEFLPKEH